MTITIPNWFVVVATIGYALSVAGAFASLKVRFFSPVPDEISAGAALNSMGVALMGVAILVSAIFFQK